MLLDFFIVSRSIVNTTTTEVIQRVITLCIKLVFGSEWVTRVIFGVQTTKIFVACALCSDRSRQSRACLQIRPPLPDAVPTVDVRYSHIFEGLP